MDVFTTRPVEQIDVKSFKDLIRGKQIRFSAHALDHLSNKQRKLFKEEDMRKTLEKDNPRRVYLQANGRYAAYYRQKELFQKIILEITNDVIVITFMNVTNIPKLDKKNAT